MLHPSRLPFSSFFYCVKLQRGFRLHDSYIYYHHLFLKITTSNLKSVLLAAGKELHHSISKEMQPVSILQRLQAHHYLCICALWHARPTRSLPQLPLANGTSRGSLLKVNKQRQSRCLTTQQRVRRFPAYHPRTHQQQYSSC